MDDWFNVVKISITKIWLLWMIGFNVVKTSITKIWLPWCVLKCNIIMILTLPVCVLTCTLSKHSQFKLEVTNNYNMSNLISAFHSFYHSLIREA